MKKRRELLYLEVKRKSKCQNLYSSFLYIEYRITDGRSKRFIDCHKTSIDSSVGSVLEAGRQEKKRIRTKERKGSVFQRKMGLCHYAGGRAPGADWRVLSRLVGNYDVGKTSSQSVTGSHISKAGPISMVRVASFQLWIQHPRRQGRQRGLLELFGANEDEMKKKRKRKKKSVQTYSISIYSVKMSRRHAN